MASKELLAKFDVLTKRFQEFEEMVEKERSKIEAGIKGRRNDYDIGEDNMEDAIINTGTINDKDIVNLNVGGQKMSTTRETLCQVEGSMLASMFSGRWEDSLSRDEDGCIFLDHNPEIFLLILDYLRAKRITTTDNPAHLPEVPSHQVKSYNSLVEYLGLNDELAVKRKIALKESFSQNNANSGIHLVNKGTSAVHSPKDGRHEYALGQNMYNDGVIQWKLKLESFKDNNWMFVGVVKGDTRPSTDASCCWPGSYGWTLGCTGGYVFANGQHTTLKTSLRHLTKQGNTVTLTLDCLSSKLSILTAGKCFQQTLPSFTTWRLNIGFSGANDKLSII